MIFTLADAKLYIFNAAAIMNFEFASVDSFYQWSLGIMAAGYTVEKVWVMWRQEKRDNSDWKFKIRQYEKGKEQKKQYAASRNRRRPPRKRNKQ